MKRPGFKVAQPLDEYRFFQFDRFEKLSELLRRNGKLAGMILAAFPQFFARQMNLPFRMAVQNRVVFGVAFHPLPVNESIGGTDIERSVADGNLFGLPSWVAEMRRPAWGGLGFYRSSRCN